MKRLVFAAAAAATLALTPALAGSLTLPGLSAGSIEVQSWSWGASNARETGSGMATGRRQYQPIRIVKQLDATSPALDEACKSGRTFPQATVSMNGQTYKLANVKLTDCTVTGKSQSFKVVVEEIVITK